MFDWVSTALQGYREVLHVSEWTGISVGALVLMAAGAYFLPETRALAIRAAVVILVGYGALLFGNHAGRADVTAQWEAANAKAADAAKERDAAAAAALEQKYAPVIEGLKAQADARDKQVSDYESTIVGLAGTCPLGDAPLQLRLRSK